MDLSFQTAQGRFNFRACAVIVHENQLLAMHDECSPNYYLPGGRVHFQESAQDALQRELREELGIEGDILRPLWVNQGFFTEDVSGERYHELCIYFLVDVSRTGLLQKGAKFRLLEGNHVHVFEWLAFSRLKDEYLYPKFIRKKIFDLPEHLVLQTEVN